jgi:hypothetical protein
MQFQVTIKVFLGCKVSVSPGAIHIHLFFYGLELPIVYGLCHFVILGTFKTDSIFFIRVGRSIMINLYGLSTPSLSSAIGPFLITSLWRFNS